MDLSHLSKHELAQKRTTLLATAQSVRDLAAAKGRELTMAEVDQIEALKSELLSVQDAIIRLNDIPAPKTRPTTVRVTGIHDCRTDDPSYGFSSVSDQLGAVLRFTQNVRDDRLDIAAAAAGHSRGAGADGGFALAPQFADTILESMGSGDDSLLALTRQFVVQGRDLEIPRDGETSRADGSRSGGIQGYWGVEAGTLTASTAKLESMKLKPNKLHVLTYTTDEVLSDSNVLEDWITANAADEINFKIGDAIVNGDGVGKPRGILLNESKVSVAKVTNQAADTVVQSNCAAMWSRMHPRGRERSVWLINNDVVPQLLDMHSIVQDVAAAENVGGYSTRLYDAASNTLIGRPVRVVEFAPTVGDQGDIILWDPRRYITAVAGGVKSEQSIHIKFLTDEVAFRWTVRVDGQCQDDTPLTQFKGSNQTSSIVVLDARA